MDHDVAGVDQHPVSRRQALDPGVPWPSFLSRSASLVAIAATCRVDRPRR
jgi:hypothetical protein